MDDIIYDRIYTSLLSGDMVCTHHIGGSMLLQLEYEDCFVIKRDLIFDCVYDTINDKYLSVADDDLQQFPGLRHLSKAKMNIYNMNTLIPKLCILDTKLISSIHINVQYILETRSIPVFQDRRYTCGNIVFP